MVKNGKTNQSNSGKSTIRIFGDLVLTQKSYPIKNIDQSIFNLAKSMFETLTQAKGFGLAAVQIGILKRIFVYDLGRDPQVLINPVITETRGEWEFEEGCLSVPGLYFPIVRPKEIHLTGYDLDGNEASIDADTIQARLFQHEIDHLNGNLLLDHLDSDTKKTALIKFRKTMAK